MQTRMRAHRKKEDCAGDASTLWGLIPIPASKHTYYGFFPQAIKTETYILKQNMTSDVI